MPPDRRCCWTLAKAEVGVPSEGMQALRFWLSLRANSSLVCDSSYAQLITRIRVVPLQQREGCTGVGGLDQLNSCYLSAALASSMRSSIVLPYFSMSIEPSSCICTRQFNADFQNHLAAVIEPIFS